METSVEIQSTSHGGSLMEHMQTTTNVMDEEQSRTTKYRNQDKKNHSMRRRRLKRRLQHIEEAHESLVRVLDLNLQEGAPGHNTTVENTRQMEPHTSQSSEAPQLMACVPNTPSNSPRLILPAIDFANPRATAASSQNFSTPVNMSISGCLSEAHALPMLQPEHCQGDMPVPHYFGSYPSLRRFQCPHCGNFMQEWCANGSNVASKPHYNGIPITSNRPLHGTMASEFPPVHQNW